MPGAHACRSSASLKHTAHARRSAALVAQLSVGDDPGGRLEAEAVEREEGGSQAAAVAAERADRQAAAEVGRAALLDDDTPPRQQEAAAAEAGQGGGARSEQDRDRAWAKLVAEEPSSIL
eukprot:COSAG01_NODE_7157_length_3325_cov_11.382207_3_plen_120_part_00